jgi:4-hydroxybenzoyl-CoA thioesterase
MKHEWSVSVSFGDCDPAGIVFYPNYYRWFDAATHAMFEHFGVGHEVTKRRWGLVGWPLIDTGAQFFQPARAGDRLVIASEVVQASQRSFRIEHRVRAQQAAPGELTALGFELRFFGQAEPVLKAAPIPAEVMAMMDEGLKLPPEHKALFEQALAADQVVLADSVGYLSELGTRSAGAILISGSHGGGSAARFVAEHAAKPRLAIFNDAGAGRQQAGTSGLALLQEHGIPAACVAHWSARIGEAKDTLEHGRITQANALGATLGCQPGVRLATLVQSLLGGPLQG